MPIAHSYVLDTDGTQMLTDAMPADWGATISAGMSEIQQGFQAEDAEGYESLVTRLRAWTWCHQVPEANPDYVSLEKIAEVATEVRSRAKALVVIGIGGSDLGTRTLHDLLDHPYHNAMVASGAIENVPQLYFTGDTFDPLRLQGLLDLLEARGMLDDVIINIVSKSGTTAETALAAMILANRLGDDWMSRTVATTGLNDKSLLYRWQADGKGTYLAMLPVPDGVGGRFSFASPVGLFPIAVTATTDPLARLKQAMQGYGDAHDTFLHRPVDENPAYQLASILHLAEYGCGKSTLIFYPYFDNRTLGDWFVQLYEESVQERGRGLNVIATTGPTGNHSLLNGIIDGARDKVVLFLAPNTFGKEIHVPESAPLEGSLAVFRGLSLEDAQKASLKGTYKDFISNEVPSAVLGFPQRDTHSVFALMRMLMDTVAIKGRLQSLHIDPDTGSRKISDEDTYIQTGVEGYKQRMREVLNT